MAAKPKGAATLSSATRKIALKKVASKTPDQFVAELKEQGIGSLEDLAKAVIGTARAGSRSGLAFDAEDFPICYKFTTYRPHFDQASLKDIVSQIDQQLLH